MNLVILSNISVHMRYLTHDIYLNSPLRWLGVLMEFLGSFVVFFAALFAILNRNHITPSQAALSLTYALNVSMYLVLSSPRLGQHLMEEV